MTITIPQASWVAEETNGSSHGPTVFAELAAQVNALDAQAARLDRLIDADLGAGSEFNLGPVEGIREGEKFWNIVRAKQRSFLKVHPSQLKEEAAGLRKLARQIAKKAFDLLPVGTVLEAETANVWHDGCPHGTPSHSMLRVEQRRPDGYQSHEGVWWRLLADNGINNSDNSREPAVHLGADWKIDSSPIKHKRGEVLLEIGNLKKVSGSYPPVKVTATKLLPKGT